MWFVSLPAAALLIGIGWGSYASRPTGVGAAFLGVWTMGIVAIEATNFRTMYLGRGRRAEAVQRALDERDARPLP